MRAKFNPDNNNQQGPITKDDAMQLKLNNAKRMPVVLLLDTSFSMRFKSDNGISKIEQLNRAILELFEFIKLNPKLRDSVEICMMTFNSSFSSDSFSLVSHKVAPRLTAKFGSTHMSTPIRSALSKIEQRKKEYRENGIHCYRPIVILLTDGGDSFFDQREYERVKQEVAVATKYKHLHFVARLIAGKFLDYDKLDALQGFDSEIPAEKINVDDFASFFKMVSNSIEQVSNSDEKIDPDGGDTFVKTVTKKPAQKKPSPKKSFENKKENEAKPQKRPIEKPQDVRAEEPKKEEPKREVFEDDPYDIL